LTLIRSALDEHKDLGRITLFIAGHTDTRGQPQHNFELSRNRARAIAAWFKQRGLGVPIAYEGFGETAPKVKTADEVDEAQNRRVDYLLAVEPPRMKTGSLPAWKQL
jgi:outer membrane protein OmpA-like peptidoglycan-associated protein